MVIAAAVAEETKVADRSRPVKISQHIPLYARTVQPVILHEDAQAGQ